MISVTMLSILTITYGVSFLIFVNHSRRIRRESHAFQEVVDIVHEAYQSAKLDMSILEIGEIKIRLSRLDLKVLKESHKGRGRKGRDQVFLFDLFSI